MAHIKPFEALPTLEGGGEDLETVEEKGKGGLFEKIFKAFKDKKKFGGRGDEDDSAAGKKEDREAGRLGGIKKAIMDKAGVSVKKKTSAKDLFLAALGEKAGGGAFAKAISKLGSRRDK